MFLYAGASADDLTKPGPRLIVVTAPGLGNVRFRVDGFDFWTHSGSWTTEYTLGPNFGEFFITGVGEGTHRERTVWRKNARAQLFETSQHNVLRPVGSTTRPSRRQLQALLRPLPLLDGL